MIARTGIVSLALMIGLALPMGGAAAAGGNRSDVEAAVFKREDGAVVAVADDDDDDGRDGANSISNSGWSTNSRKTPVTRNRDLSRGGLTRDRTDDGKGKPKRDWSKHQTNDRSRNDSR